jgi:uncharacterized membrane protein YgdD (TMEM256/DUF423 family)
MVAHNATITSVVVVVVVVLVKLGGLLLLSGWVALIIATLRDLVG